MHSGRRYFQSAPPFSVRRGKVWGARHMPCLTTTPCRGVGCGVADFEARVTRGKIGVGRRLAAGVQVETNVLSFWRKDNRSWRISHAGHSACVLAALAGCQRFEQTRTAVRGSTAMRWQQPRHAAFFVAYTCSLGVTQASHTGVNLS